MNIKSWLTTSSGPVSVTPNPETDSQLENLARRVALLEERLERLEQAIRSNLNVNL